MKPILEIQKLGKRFNLRHQTGGYASLRDSLSNLLTSSKIVREDFWALKDVSFDVYPGDSVGIVGRNGAGKSTLLKILSRITPPTEGKIKMRGRIASLLEVGTGFHPELTGRENIFFNGSILGMRRKEIEKHFDAIVDFAGTEKFLDTPLKHYSSGMQLRLAFAVAAFLEPEILVIDEVLAVGDAEFQKKCMGKMEDVSKSGRTILFVSHNMAAIQSLCAKGLFIDKGKTNGIVSINEAVKKYLYEGVNQSGHEIFCPKEEKLEAILLEAKLLNYKRELSTIHETCEDIFVELTWQNYAGIPVNVSIELHSYTGTELFNALDTPNDFDGKKKQTPGLYKSTARIPKNLLKAGEYFFRFGLYSPAPTRLIDLQRDKLSFSLIDPMDERCLARGVYSYQFNNTILLPALDWISQKTD
ncbi:MAG: ATP-binding cassette domain-containing protein [Bacteroidetes bacterium]|nr:ATP-binding cassette domain-containing protein [Bacteroidota bacterium]MBS1540536.1 ATP-binding cassette domain-containing protein [Bacteroidota bacterium]